MYESIAILKEAFLMQMKKVYSKPMISIDRSVFESIDPISDEWIGWDSSDIDEESSSGDYSDDIGGGNVSSFDENTPTTTDGGGGWEWNW